MTARELAARYGITIGCIDNSCVFGRPEGMGTNGGCRCAGGRAPYSSDVVEMRRLIHTLAGVLSAIAKEQL